MIKVVVQPEISVNLTDIVILAVRDIFCEKRIIARVAGLPRAIVLWGPSDYDSEEAQNWTNDSAYERAVEMLSKEEVPFD